MQKTENISLACFEMQNTIEENILNKKKTKKLFALISNWNNHPIIKKKKKSG